MKIEASTSLLPRMAESYREFGLKRQAEGDETAAAAGIEAANALEEVAELRKQVETLARRHERKREALAKIWQLCSGGTGPTWEAKASLDAETIQRIRDLADLKDQP